MGTNTLQHKLATYDNKPFLPLWEYEIHSSLEHLVKEQKLSTDDISIAELFAFAFFENNQNEQSYWGTYFGPLISHTNDNQIVDYEYPSLNQVTSQMVDYWEKRSSEVTHPILVARYIGLVWDFSLKIRNKKPNHKIGEQYVTAILTIANERLYKEPIYAITKVKRALSVALSLNNQNLVSEVKNTVIALEKEIGIEEKPGLWGFVYDILHAGKKSLLTSGELDEVIRTLEIRMANLHSTNPWACKAAVNRLAEYYNRAQKPEDVKRVLFELGNSYLSYAEQSSSIQAAGYVEELYHLFSHYNLRTEANELLIKLRETQKKTAADFKTIATSVDIPNEKIEQFVDQVLKGTGEEIFMRILYAHIPSLKETEADLSKIAMEHPIRYLMKTGIVDSKGRIVAQIGSIDDDLEGHKAAHFSNSLKYSGIGLHFVFKEAIKRNLLTVSNLMNFLKQSCIIANERFAVIEQGISEFLNKNYIVSIHMLIPQIEDAIRNLIEINGGNIFVYKNGAFHLKTFDHILTDTIVKEVLGEDTSYYYRILFTDSRGWNLRNNVAHGFVDPTELDEQTNERLIHALLVLGMIRWKAIVKDV